MKKGSERRNSWPRLKAELDKRRWHYQRIEDKLTPGIPDLNIHVPGQGDVWIELKYLDTLPRTDNNKVTIGLSREQFIWLRDASQAGRTVWLMARIGRDWYGWKDVDSWNLAKHPNPWVDLKRKVYKFVDIDSFLQLLEVGGIR